MSAKLLKAGVFTAIGATVLFGAATLVSLKPITRSFDTILLESRAPVMSASDGAPLSVSYQTRWNTHNALALYDMPELLVQAFLYSEDRKFYNHGGVDWPARGAALWQNVKQRRSVRGASTITEQVVRLINPRPRNLWSKWLEGIEATILERHVSKPAILEFYLNQVPYASERRGVVQAARHYFNRDLSTLSAKETLALAILPRAPSTYDLRRNEERIAKPLMRLAAQMHESGLIADDLYNDIASASFALERPSLPIEARHFARYARQQSGHDARTTLDPALQSQVQDILDTRLQRLSGRNVQNGGALVIDHQTGHILAWVVAGARDADTPGGEIDTILTPRQPGSTLKPFLYAAALETGWNAATMLNDAPIAEAVGSGLHRFRNYSGHHYGPITLREALGNSLNIPAVLAINRVGPANFLNDLHRLNIKSLDRNADHYDEGLALGNGEVTLLELTRAYAALANRGQYQDAKTSLSSYRGNTKRIYCEETASIIGDILSDPRARSLEFGRDSVLNFPHRTAAKTGTSTDYRDAWTIAYNDRYTVGIWMGNLDRSSMQEVTGSTGPSLAVRAIFNILNRNRDTKPLYLSPALIETDICTRPAAQDGSCPRRNEYFAKAPEAEIAPASPQPRRIELVRPTAGLHMSMDPRLPANHQKFRFELSNLETDEEVEWILNGESLGRSSSPRHLWALQKGRQRLAVVIHAPDKSALTLEAVTFFVR